MQDNEFDELFRSKLDDFELKPLPHVWSNIDAELKTGRKKNVLAPFLSVAASIIVLVAAGVLFVPKKTLVITGAAVANNNVKTSVPGKPDIKKSISKQTVTPNLKGKTVAATKSSSINYTKGVNLLKSAQFDKKTEEKAATEKGEQSSTTSLYDNPKELIKPAVDREEPEIAVTQTVEIANSFITKPVQMRSQLTGVNKTELPSVKPKYKMHSLGDLINAVVAKVDKRKDKFIEFTDKDEESLITGVNLGIIKIKKEEQTTDK